MDVKVRIAAARRMLYREGCDSQTAGHISLRVPEEDAMWATVLQEFDETIPSDVVKLSHDLDLLEGEVSTVLSPALAFHSSIYAARPDVNCVIHHHGHYTSVIASTGQVVRQFNVTANPFYEDQAVIMDDADGTAWDESKIPNVLGNKSVLLMHNHGCIVVGPSLELTTVKAMLLEIASKFQLECMQVGGIESADGDYIRANAKLQEGYLIPQMWESRLRRLRKSDPDLFEMMASV